jgi:mannose-6-phosphate isomerase
MEKQPVTENPALYPLLLQPSLHVKVWGGRQLETVMHKPLPTDEPYGESWEMHDTATVANGALAGKQVGEVLALYGKDLCGKDNDPALGMPLLAKLLDATDWLSVQVHPNDDQAQQLDNEARGKTEAWYVIAAQPGAKLVIGVHPGTLPAEIAQAIRTNSLERLLVYAEVAPGDVLYIPAGTIHALGPGILIYEIQQSSDLTYRLYDWGRPGLDGKPRQLHVEKSITVANTEKLPAIRHTGSSTAAEVEIVDGEYFRTVLHQLNAANGEHVELDTGKRAFHILTCIDGAVSVEHEGTLVSLGMGQTSLIPAALGRYAIRGTGNVLRSWQP